MAEVMHRARRGDPEAIGWLLNQALAPRGISARVWRSARQLQILVDGDPLPRQQLLVDLLAKGIRRLHPPLIRHVQIYGRIRGGSEISWMEVVDLFGSACGCDRALANLWEPPEAPAAASPLARYSPVPSWVQIGLWGSLVVGTLAWLGSGAQIWPISLQGLPQGTQLDPVDPLDPLDPLDSLDPVDPVSSKTLTLRSSIRQRYPAPPPGPYRPPFDARLLPPLPTDLPGPCEAARSGPYFQFLGDACGQKRFPSDPDRDKSCPVQDSEAKVTLADGQLGVYRPAEAEVGVDEGALVGWVPQELKVTVILIRRIDGVPHYRYLSNGTQAQTFQPWSASKFMAVAIAAATLRMQSEYQVGLGASVDGHDLGDLITSLHTYSYDPYSSNSLARYFQQVGGAARANALIHEAWLQRPGSESFGGGYGEGNPPLSYRFTEADGRSLQIQPQGTGLPNHLSSFTLAEFLKRLVMHREDPATRLPGIQWSDLKVLLFGSEWDGEEWGGMSRDLSLYLQSYAMDYLADRSQGQWRTVSKLGLGRGELVSVGYACFPALDEQGQILPDWGREFVIAARLAEGGASWRERDRLLAQYHRQIIEGIIQGEIR